MGAIDSPVQASAGNGVLIYPESQLLSKQAQLLTKQGGGGCDGVGVGRRTHLHDQYLKVLKLMKTYIIMRFKMSLNICLCSNSSSMFIF